MDLTRTAMALVRRWWLTLPLLALTITAALTVHQERPVVFRTEQAAALRGPASSASAPRAGVGPSGQLISTVLESDRVGTAIRDGLDGGSYDVSASDDPAGTLLVLAGEARTPEVAVELVRRLLAAVEPEIRDLETAAAVTPEERARVESVAVPLTAERVEIPRLGEDPEIRHVAEGAVLVRAPELPTSPFGADPTTLQFVQELLATDPVVERLRPEGTTASALVVDPRGRSPLFHLTAEGETPIAAARALSVLHREVQAQLAALQVDVRPEARTRMVAVTGPDLPERVEAQVERAVVVLVGLGLFATATLPVLVDGAILSRRARRDGEGDDAADGEGEGDPGAPGRPRPAHPRTIDLRDRDGERVRELVSAARSTPPPPPARSPSRARVQGLLLPPPSAGVRLPGQR